MTGEGTALRVTAVRNLTALGLSEYAARTLVALTRLGGGSARDVSETSDVPRTRVYDAVDELAAHGFVTVRESHPKEFVPVSPQRIRRAFYREYVYREVVTEWGLRTLEPDDDRPRSQDVFSETGEASIDDQFFGAIEECDGRLTYVSVAEPPSAHTLDLLANAADRNVSVRVICVGDIDPAGVRDQLPSSTVLTVPNTVIQPSGGTRFLIADESRALLGIEVETAESSTEVGLISDRPGTDLTILLQRVVDTWLADIE